MNTMALTRIHGAGWAEQISVAHRLIGPALTARLAHVQYVAGVDPIFAGLFNFTDTDDGRSYRDTSCCAYPWHLNGPRDRRVTTIVCPVYRPGWGGIKDLVHELGHALDLSIGFEHKCIPVTNYAKTNEREAFAESFTSWVWGDGLPGYGRPARRDAALFDTLERGATV